jgi:hypothetical protein
LRNIHQFYSLAMVFHAMFMLNFKSAPSARYSRDYGLAIGPILFIVGIIGILAAAIGASGGSFTGNAQSEAARTNASALIQVGVLLKNGMSRMLVNGADFTTINIVPTATTGDNDLFSLSGGGVSAPSTTLAETPATDIWYYPFAAIPNIGSSATDRLAMLKINLATCNQVNIRINAIGTAASDSSMGDDIGDVTQTTLAGAASWPVPLQGKESGCVRNTNSTTPGYFFYQAIGSR